MSSAISAFSPLLPRAATDPSTAPQAPNSAQSGSTPSISDPLANEQTFLKLLVSQLQNQDPLNPTDSNQFVSQLTAYSQLEQLIGIRQNTAPASTNTTAAGPTATTPGNSTQAVTKTA
jgi:flagellar basal-body rod modification protein FlgD